MIGAVGSALEEEAPGFVLVYGDTNSTLAGAIAASWLGLPVGHVEAGLRSHNRVMREERTRVLVDHLADVLFCPTPLAVANLRSEGVTDGVHQVGDVMYDAALAARAAVEARPDGLCERLAIQPGGYNVATVHRAETTDDAGQLRSVLEYLDRVAEEAPVVFPMHPRTRKAAKEATLSTGRLLVIEPLSYLDMTELVMHARTVYTDSGGLQKEAYFHRVPCVTLRSETEWVETIEAGWNRLWTEPAYAPRHEIAATATLARRSARCSHALPAHEAGHPPTRARDPCALSRDPLVLPRLARRVARLG
jgi:UDP-GlcNAc3NAcA epimerase